MRRWVILLACLLVLLLAAPLAGAWYALYTPGGLATILHLVPRRLPGAEVRIEGARGTLARALHVDLVEVRVPRVDVRLHDVDLQPSLRLLVLQTLQLRSATVGSLEIQVFHHPNSNAPVRFLPHWLNLHVDALHIGRLHLTLPSGRTFDASDLSGHGIVRPRTIRYYDARMNTGATAWRSGEGILRGTQTLGIEAGLDLGYHVAGQVPWSMALTANGDLDALKLSARFMAPFDATYLGQALDLSDRWRLKGELAVRHIDLYTWGGSHDLGAASGSVHVEGNLDGFTAQGPVLVDMLKAGALDLRLHAAYANRVLTLQEAQAMHPQLGWRVLAHGSVGVEKDGPRLDLTGSWNDLRLPLAARDGLHSHAATFSVSGIWPYAAHSAGEVQIPNLPPMSYDLTGSLFKDHAEVTSATVFSPGGTAKFSGRLSWPPRLDWSATGTVAEFDPAVFAKVSSGRLAFGFDAHGAGFRPDGDFSLQLRDLVGVIRGLPAHGAGNLAHSGATWRFDAIRAQVGGAAIALDGTLGGDGADMKFDLRAPDLGLLHTGWQGHLAAVGTVHGTFRDPAIDASASGGAIQYGQVALGNLEARVDMDSHRSGASHVQLHVRGLGLGTRHIDDAVLRLEGATTHHDLTLALAAGQFRLDAAGSGSFSDGSWRADLAQVRARGGDEINLSLENSASLLLSPSSVHVSQLCLTGQPARLCAGGDWTAAHWSLAAAASDLPMQTLTAGSAAGLDYHGNIGLRLALAGGAGQRPTGSLVAQLANAQMLRRLASGRTETTTLGSGTVTVNAGPEAIAAQLGLDAGALGSIKGVINAQRGASDWRELPLSGQVNLETAELDFIPIYVPQVDRAAGRLSASLVLGGTLGSPLLNGSLALTGGELDLYRVNLAMRATSLNATLTGNSLQFDGAAQLGNGNAAARGSLQWQNGAPHGSFKLTGENLRVADVPEAQIDASPDLVFNIDGTDIAVTGTVKVPHAHIAPADLTNAVLPSSDEIIVDDTQPEDTAARFKVTTDVTLALGDDVSIESRGLKARLAGSITTHTGTDEQVTRASGEVSVAQGDYTAYGRKLDIDRGRLIFNGGPVGDPGIDVRAVKHFDDPTVGATLAGINVRGTLRNPRLSFFSEPPLPQQQIVQLVMAGGGLMAGQTNGVAGTTNASRGATNNELLGQGAAIIGQQLGSKIGIQDVGVESNIYNETSLVLGRYLSPRLYISYGLGLTQTLNTVKLRYTLGDHWMIRTEAGQVGGADLVYTLDK